MTHNNSTAADRWLEQERFRIVPLQEAARLRGVSIDTLKRYHRHQFVRLSERRLGMRLADVLDAEAS
jgi:hypothetical protein